MKNIKEEIGFYKLKRTYHKVIEIIMMDFK